MKYKIGTRGSKLALAQSTYIKSKLEQLYPKDEFEICIVQTTGDRLNTVPLNQVGQSGVFVKEIEERMQNGALDFAVHSMKDMESRLPEQMAVTFCGLREDARDALLLREKKSLKELPYGATIGTGSPRRKYQLLKLRPDLKVVGIRGNIETRIQKMHDQQLDGVILAAAGLKRLGLEDKITHYFSVDEMIPAPAQGVLGLEYRKDRADIQKLLEPLRNKEIEELISAERLFLKLTQAGCHQPVAASAIKDGTDIKMRIMYGDELGEQIIYSTVSEKNAENAARAAFQYIKKYTN